ncbi:MAG: hypothetical protein D6723_05250 [Acidobacteria bacterium]|nr:MAG: hypothetical protein D6723_05250 [Acidobacteriota bacterium]
MSDRNGRAIVVMAMAVVSLAVLNVVIPQLFLVIIGLGSLGFLPITTNFFLLLGILATGAGLSFIFGDRALAGLLLA